MDRVDTLSPRMDVPQKTIKRSLTLSGKGLFTGENVILNIHPAPVGHGVIFQRVDLPDKPLIPAHLDYVTGALRCTRLATKTASVLMVEHLLSAISALELDNLLIEVEGPEMPACDGSARLFCELLDQSGVIIQDEPKRLLKLSQPLFYSDKETHLIAVPSDEFRISYTLHYPQSALLGSQYFSLAIKPELYKNEIAPSRTFSLYEEIFPLIEQGLIKGGGLENALVIKGEQVLNPEGMRYSNEMVRHKILDLIGDLSLLGENLIAHVFAIRSGHASNIAFAKLLKQVNECL